MSKATYNVIAIHPGRRQDYMDFWKNGVKTNAKGEVLHPALLADSVTVDARNKEEAEALVRKSHPNYSIDSSATERIG